MSETPSVWSVCPYCRRNLECLRAPSGTWYLPKHKPKGKGKQCEGSIMSVDPPAPPTCQTAGCWRPAADDSIHCEDCRDFYRGRGLTYGLTPA